MAIRVKGQPIPLDDEGRWLGRIDCIQVDGVLWPYRIDIRLNGDEVPPGGFPMRLLRKLRLSDAQQVWREAAQNAKQHGATPVPASVIDSALAAADRDREAMRDGPKPLGRPPAPQETHLRRLAVLDRFYRDGKPQVAAARAAGVSVVTMRESLRWARDRGLWTKDGTARRGQLTDAGRAAIERAGI